MPRLLVIRDFVSRQPTGGVWHRLYVNTIYLSSEGARLSGCAFSCHRTMIAGNPKTGRRMTFLIASLCILILIILTILLLRDDRTPWTPSNEPTLHPSTFVLSSLIQLEGCDTRGQSFDLRQD